LLLSYEQSGAPVAFPKIEHKRNKTIKLILLPELVFIFIFGWGLYWIGLQRDIEERKTSRMGTFHF
jgi:hypothetical protein